MPGSGSAQPIQGPAGSTPEALDPLDDPWLAEAQALLQAEIAGIEGDWDSGGSPGPFNPSGPDDPDGYPSEPFGQGPFNPNAPPWVYYETGSADPSTSDPVTIGAGTITVDGQQYDFTVEASDFEVVSIGASSAAALQESVDGTSAADQWLSDTSWIVNSAGILFGGSSGGGGGSAAGGSESSASSSGTGLTAAGHGGHKTGAPDAGGASRPGIPGEDPMIYAIDAKADEIAARDSELERSLISYDYGGSQGNATWIPGWFGDAGETTSFPWRTESPLANIWASAEVAMQWISPIEKPHAYYSSTSVESRALLDTGTVHEVLSQYYAKSAESGDYLDSYTRVGVQYGGSTLEAHALGRVNVSVRPERLDQTLVITVENVSSWTSFLEHHVPAALDEVTTNVPLGSAQSFPDDTSGSAQSIVRATPLALPGGNVAQTYTIVVPMDYMLVPGFNSP